MNALRYSPYSDSFSRPVAISAAIHVTVFVVLAIRATWFPSEPLMIRDAIRVDIVGLPDKVQNEEPAAPAPEQTKKIEQTKAEPKKVEAAKAEPPKVVTKPAAKTKDTQRKALEKLKAMDAIEKMKGEVSEAKAAAEAGKRAKAFRGNAITSGNSLTGLERLDFDRYFATIEQQIRANWHLPGWLAQAQLRAQALVMINENGQVIKRELVSSSGNEVFDAEVLDAIDKSTFEPPPPRLRDILALRGIVFSFPERGNQ